MNRFSGEFKCRAKSDTPKATTVYINEVKNIIPADTILPCQIQKCIVIWNDNSEMWRTSGFASWVMPSFHFSSFCHIFEDFSGNTLTFIFLIYLRLWDNLDKHFPIVKVRFVRPYLKLFKILQMTFSSFCFLVWRILTFPRLKHKYAR